MHLQYNTLDTHHPSFTIKKSLPQNFEYSINFTQTLYKRKRETQTLYTSLKGIQFIFVVCCHFITSRSLRLLWVSNSPQVGFITNLHTISQQFHNLVEEQKLTCTYTTIPCRHHAYWSLQQILHLASTSTSQDVLQTFDNCQNNYS